MTTGLGINAMPDPNNNGSYIGRLPRDERRVIAAQFPNTGVINTPVITTSASALTYKVGANVVVASRGASDGSTIFPVDEATLTVAATSGNPRIDVIYAYQHDYEQGDADNQSGYGVVQGIASASPTEPAVPANTQRVAAMRLPANASTTTGATQVNGVVYAIPYGGSLGVFPRQIDTRNGALPAGPETWGYTTVSLPTDRALDLRVYLTLSGTGVTLIDFMIDGQLYSSRKLTLTSNWQTLEMTTVAELEAGTHVLSVRRTQQTGEAIAHCGLIDGVAYPGQVFRARDLGVVG